METISDITTDSFYSHPKFQAFFRTSRQSLILRADAPLFAIIAVSDDYLAITHKRRSEVLHQNLFEVFPGSDTDPSQQNSVYDSFMRVIRTRERDILPIFIYEIFNTKTGKKQTEYWSNINEPVLDDNGNVSHIINTTANITAQMLGEKAIDEANQNKIDLSRARQQNERLLADNTEQRRLHEELKRTYECEQILGEELSASNERMLAINEELLSTNEQLQVMHDVLVQTNIRLVVAEERVRLSTEAANIGTFAIELESGKFSVSRRTCDIFGVTPTDNLSLDDFVVLMDDAHRDRVSGAINNTLHTKTAPFFEEYALIRKSDGAKRWVRALGNTRTMGEDKTPVFAGVVIDITEQKEDAERMDDFINLVGHEIKTPLTSLSGYLQILQMNADSNDEITLRILEKASRQTTLMANTVNSFLNVSKLDSGKDEISKTRFDMSKILLDMEYETRALYNSHPFTFHPIEHTPILADKDKICQVIHHLISNAVKYSAPGSEIDVSCTVEGAVAKLCVKDIGIGISSEEIPKLFDRYYRVENGKAKSVSGFGLGLYICSQIIKRHDGTLWVESEEGKGSMFCFTLPVLTETSPDV